MLKRTICTIMTLVIMGMSCATIPINAIADNCEAHVFVTDISTETAIRKTDVSVETVNYEEEIPEGFENELIEAALFESGYFCSKVPLDGDTQAFLRAACEEFDVPFELVLAIIHQETDFQNIAGDGGKSVGYMQIQPRWNRDRMERLGVVDLFNPYDNFRVGCDLLSELLSKYDVESALTAYNRGTPGRSNYAKSVIAYMETLAQK